MSTIEKQENGNPSDVTWLFCSDERPPINNEPFIVTDGEGFYSIGYHNLLYRSPTGQLRMPARYGQGMDVNYWMPISDDLLWTPCREQLPPESSKPLIFTFSGGSYVIGYSNGLYEIEGRHKVRGYSKAYVLSWAVLPVFCKKKKTDKEGVTNKVYRVEFHIKGTEDNANALRRSLAQCVSDEFEIKHVFGVTVDVSKD